MGQNKQSPKGMPPSLKLALWDAQFWTNIHVISSTGITDRTKPLVIKWRGREYELYAVMRDV